MSEEQEKLLKECPNPISISQTEIILDQMKKKCMQNIYEKRGKGYSIFLQNTFS